MPALTIRKLADTSSGTRVVRYHPETGEKKLVNPDTPGDDHEPWPLAGVRIEGDPPTRTRVPTSWVAVGVAEGWIEGINERPVVRPAGPVQTAWNSSHTGSPHVFMHYDALVLHTVDGDVRYRVTRQPDKYADHSQATHEGQVDPFEADDDTPVTPEIYAAGATRVDHFFDLALEG